jgi:hypothetical protein
LTATSTEFNLELFPNSLKEPSDSEDPDLEYIAYAKFQKAVRGK